MIETERVDCATLNFAVNTWAVAGRRGGEAAADRRRATPHDLLSTKAIAVLKADGDLSSAASPVLVGTLRVHN